MLKWQWNKQTISPFFHWLDAIQLAIGPFFLCSENPAHFPWVWCLVIFPGQSASQGFINTIKHLAYACGRVWVSVICSAWVSNAQSRLVVWPRTDDPVLYHVTFVQRGIILTLYNNSAFKMKLQLVCPSLRPVKVTKKKKKSPSTWGSVFSTTSYTVNSVKSTFHLKWVYSNIGL